MIYETTLKAITIQGVEYLAEDGKIDLPDAFASDIADWVRMNKITQIVMPVEDGIKAVPQLPVEPPIEPPAPPSPTPAPVQAASDVSAGHKRGRAKKE